MTTYQSTSLHVEDSRERSLAFTVADNPAEDDYAMKAWSTQILPDGQVVNVEIEFTPDDVRDLQAYLRDRFGNRVRELPETAAAAEAVKIALNNLLVQGYRIIAPNGSDMGPDNVPFLLPVDPTELAFPVASEQIRQCAVIYNDVQPHDFGPITATRVSATVTYDPSLPVICNRIDLHHHMLDSTGVHWVHDGAEEQCPLPDNHHPILIQHPPNADGVAAPPADQDAGTPPAAESATPTAAPSATSTNTEPSEAEKGRRRRLKVEMEFDEALEAWNSDPNKMEPGNTGTWTRLVAAHAAVKKREPENSRVRRPIEAFSNYQIAAPTEELRIPGTGPTAAEPGPQFAPEPPAGMPVNAPWSQNPDGSASFNVLDAAQQGASYIAQAQHPMNQQFIDAANALPGEHVQDSVIMTPEEAAASQAFPCPQHSADGRPCLRPFGHELVTATNPDPKPHIYPTSQQLLEAQGQQYGVPPVQQHPVTGFIAPAAAGSVGAAPLSFQVPPTPEQAQPHPDLVQQPAAPAAPFWQAPQT